MATAQQSAKQVAPKFERLVREELSRAVRRVRFLDLAKAGLGLFIMTMLFGLGMMLLDKWLTLPQVVRQIALISYLVFAAIYGWFVLLRPIRRAVNPYYAAIQVEQTIPDAKNSLVNWLDLHDEGLPDAVKSALGKRAASDLEDCDVQQAIRSNALVYLGATAAGLVIGLLIAFGVLRPDQFRSLLARTFSPFSATAIAKQTRISIVKPAEGDAQVGINRPVTIVVNVEGRIPPKGKPDSLRLIYRYRADDDAFVDMPLEQAEHNQAEWSVRVPPNAVQNGFWYRVAGGDDETREHRIQVRSSPLTDRFEATLKYRPYLRFDDRWTTDPNIKDFRGTEVTLTVVTNRQVREGRLIFKDRNAPIVGELIPDRPDALRFHFRIDKDTTYQIAFTTTEDETSNDPLPYKIEALRDQMPEVNWTKPAELAGAEPEDMKMRADSTVNLEAIARDDFGITKMALRMKLDGKVLEPQPYTPPTGFKLDTGGFMRSVHYKDFIDLSKLRQVGGGIAELKTGMVLEGWLEAEDNCDYEHAQVGRSKPFRIVIMPPKVNDNLPPEEKEKKQEERDRERKQAEQDKKDNEKNHEQDRKKQSDEDRRRQEERRDEQKRNEEKMKDKAGDRKNEGKPDQNPKNDPNKQGEPKPGDQQNPKPENKPGEKSEIDKKLDKVREELNRERNNQNRDAKAEDKPAPADPPPAEPGAKPNEPQGEPKKDPMAGDGMPQPGEMKPKPDMNNGGAAGDSKPSEAQSQQPRGDNKKPGESSNDPNGMGDPKKQAPEGGPNGASEAKAPPKPGDKPMGGMNDGMDPKGGDQPGQAKGAPKDQNPMGGAANDPTMQPRDPNANTGKPGESKPDTANQQGAAKNDPQQKQGGGPQDNPRNAQNMPGEAKPKDSQQARKADSKTDPNAKEGQPASPNGDAKANQGGQPQGAEAASNKPDSGMKPMGNEVAKGEPKPDGAQNATAQKPGGNDTAGKPQDDMNKLAEQAKAGDQQARQKLEDMAKNAGDPQKRQAAEEALKNARAGDPAQAKSPPQQPKPGDPMGTPADRVADQKPDAKGAQQAGDQKPGDPMGQKVAQAEPKPAPGGEAGQKPKADAKPEPGNGQQASAKKDGQDPMGQKPGDSKPGEGNQSAKAGEPKAGKPGEGGDDMGMGGTGDGAGVAKSDAQTPGQGKPMSDKPGQGGGNPGNGSEATRQNVGGNTAPEDRGKIADANQDFKNRSGQMNLEDVDKDTLKKMFQKHNITEEEWKKYLANKAKDPPTKTDPKDLQGGSRTEGGFVNQGARRVEGTPDGSGTDLRSGRSGNAPPEYKTAAEKFAERLAQPLKPKKK